MGVPFPFSAIVGQDEMKLALTIAAVDPGVGGVLVLGDRGTGKSTAVRALAAVLPQIVVVDGCRYGCDPADRNARCDECREARLAGPLKRRRAAVPVVDLPLGATEDRVAGALDLERALVAGEARFQPGLLARAHRGFLYVDEVNLLEDHIVDLLLDVAASGENVVEREGLSLRHPARFVLIGSCNPEEGELRPQLLDRFGLAVEITTPAEIAVRVEIVRRRDRFDTDAEAFAKAWAAENAALRQRIAAARSRVAGDRRAGGDAGGGGAALFQARHRRAARRTDPAAGRASPGGARRRRRSSAWFTCGGSHRWRCAIACGAIRSTPSRPRPGWRVRSTN